MKLKSKTRYLGQSWLNRVKLNSVSSSMLLLSMVILLCCAKKGVSGADNSAMELECRGEDGEVTHHLTTNNYVRDIVEHPAFEGFGELLLPRDDNSGYYNTQLHNVSSLMPYHSHVEPNIVVGALNHMIDEVNDGKTSILRILYRRAKATRSE